MNAGEFAQFGQTWLPVLQNGTLSPHPLRQEFSDISLTIHLASMKLSFRRASIQGRGYKMRFAAISIFEKEHIMEKQIGYFALLGLLIGAIFGAGLGAANGNTPAGLAVGALAGVFLGWFIATIVSAQKSEK